MKRIDFNTTSDSPNLTIENEVGFISLSGNAIAHNPDTRYSWLEQKIWEYCKHPKGKSTLAISLTHLSTSASKWLYHMLKEIEKLHSVNSQFTILWYYQDENDVMQEIGEDFKQIIDMPFRLIAA